MESTLRWGCPVDHETNRRSLRTSWLVEASAEGIFAIAALAILVIAALIAKGFSLW